MQNIRLSKSPAEKGLENMQYNREKGIWYSKEEIFKNPVPIDDYEQFLSHGISKRIKSIHTDLDIKYEDLYSDKPSLIRQIVNGKSSYKSFITDEILKSIIENSNAMIKNYKGNNLPKKITRFWIIFGDERDICDFLKRVYYNICLNILTDKQEKYKTEADKIFDLFYADASFSLIQGQAKIDDRDITINPNEKERRALVSAIKYTWSLISDDVLESFRNTFDINAHSFFQIKNSKNIQKKIDEWCISMLLPYLQQKEKELKKDSIANIGYCVHNIMETLYEKKIIDNNYILNEYHENLKFLCSESDNYLLDCAKKLEKSQCTYFTSKRNSDLEKSIIEDVDKYGDYELEGDYYSDDGTKISFSSSGKSIEELIDEALITRKNK